MSRSCGLEFSLSNSPKHIAIIMDGNGRWAAARGLPRTAGHKKGVDAVREAIEAAGEFGVKYLTLFGFSSENWSRPETEIKELMRLLRYYLQSEIAELHSKNICLKIIGDRSKFDADILELMGRAESLTADNNALSLTIALNYGGRHDIAQAAARLMQDGTQDGQDLSTEDIAAKLPEYLMTANMPEPDLLIRTSGEQRISNFLLWQCAYTEMVFTDVLWPDFGRTELAAAIDEYARRERRFGNISGQRQNTGKTPRKKERAERR